MKMMSLAGLLATAFLVVPASAQVKPERAPEEKPGQPTRPTKPSLPELPAQREIPTQIPRQALPRKAATRVPNAGAERSLAAIYHINNNVELVLAAPGLEAAEKVELRAERKGVCGWTESWAEVERSLASSSRKAVSVRSELSTCETGFVNYNKALERLAGQAAEAGELKLFVGDNHYVDNNFKPYFGQPVHLKIYTGNRIGTYTLEGTVQRQKRRTDADGDGFFAIDSGGDDCDDSDADRYPGNSEVPDADGHDEDCDTRTIGDRDLDGDGFIDARVFNAAEGMRTYYGDDCDDLNPAVHPHMPEDFTDGIDNNCDGEIDHYPD